MSPAAPTDSPRPHSPHPTAPEDVVSRRQRWGIGIGRMVDEATQNSIHLLASPILNMTLGMSPAALSTLSFLQRVCDAFTDPLIGAYSDNFRSRWGRRLPLMLVAAPLLALLFVGIWFFPRDASSTHLYVHVLVFTMLFYTVHTLYCVPLAGLALEATDDYHERTRLVAFTVVFGFIVNILGQWLFPLTQLDIFPDTITGLRWVTGIGGVFFLITALLPVWLCHERLYKTVAAKQPTLSLWASLKLARTVPSFMRVVIARALYTFGYNIVSVFVLYMNTYYVFGGDVKASAVAYGFIGGAFHIAGLVTSVVIFPPLIKRWGKQPMFQVASLIMVVGCLLKLVVYRPGEPWWQLFITASNGAASAGMNLASFAMLGDIADHDELQNGVRREAMLGAIITWVSKAGHSLGALLSGFILVWIGFDATRGAQTPETLAAMKYAYVLMPLLGALAALFVARKITLTEEEAYAVKAKLAERRARL